MQIGFTKEEFLRLLHIIEIADWVLNAWKEEEDEQTAEYRALFQKLFRKSREFKLNNLFETLSNGELAFNSEYEENYSIQEFIDEFEDDSFWTELIDRLTARDFRRKYGMEAISKMELKDKIEKEYPIESKWVEEFKEHGLARIELNTEIVTDIAN